MNKSEKENRRKEDHMKLRGKKIGVALTGSFCTYEKVFAQLRKLKEEGAEIVTIFPMPPREQTADSAGRRNL